MYLQLFHILIIFVYNDIEFDIFMFSPYLKIRYIWASNRSQKQNKTSTGRSLREHSTAADPLIIYFLTTIKAKFVTRLPLNR